MAELADALDLGSSGQPCGFDPHYPYQPAACDVSHAAFLFCKNKAGERTRGYLPEKRNPAENTDAGTEKILHRVLWYDILLWSAAHPQETTGGMVD